MLDKPREPSIFFDILIIIFPFIGVKLKKSSNFAPCLRKRMERKEYLLMRREICSELFLEFWKLLTKFAVSIICVTI